MTTYKWGKYNWKKDSNKIFDIKKGVFRVFENNDRASGHLNPNSTHIGLLYSSIEIDLESGVEYRFGLMVYETVGYSKSNRANMNHVFLNAEVVARNYVEKFGRYVYELDGRMYNAEPKKTTKIGEVTSTNRNAYPDEAVKEDDNYYYEFLGIANQAPTISGKDEDWGGYKQAFKRYYSVDDGDSGQQLNVVVTLNGVTIATVNNATRKTDYPIDIDGSKFNALTLNEQNTIEITVTDSSGATAVRRYTFKRINTAPVVTMTNTRYGEQNKPFTINFEAADPDGDEITVKLFIDDVQIKDLGTIKGKQSVTIPKIDFAKIPNGEHKIRVEAKDSYNAVGVGYADFSKNLTYPGIGLKKNYQNSLLQ